MASLTLSINAKPWLSKEVYDELASIVKGPVFCPTDPEFTERSKTFNGKIKPLSRMVVSPLDAEDVSKVVKFCLKHNLSPSVKAGGYGIAGWSVAGDVIIDMSLIRHVDIEPPIPEEEGGCRWTPLKDMPPPGSKGKGKASEVKRKIEVVAIADPPQKEATSMKRRRDDRGDSPTPIEKVPAYGPTDDESRSRVYDAASSAVGAFFRGPPLPLVPGETPREPPRNKRRIDSPVPENSTDVVHHLPLLESKQLSSESSAGGGSTSGSAFGFSTERTLSTETAVTTPTDTPLDSADNALASVAESNITPTAATEPFGYMSSGPPASRPPMYTGSEPFAYMSSASTVLTPSNIPSSWRPPAAVSWTGPSINPSAQGSSSAMLSFMPSLPSMPGTFALPQSHVGNVAPARPVYDHAYVTFGAGMRQKEVDTFTAENPLEGISSASGLREEGLVPYHIPTSAHPVGSSVMILSGFGFLSRLYGLSIDNVVEIEMVLADGRIVIVNKDDDPDLWWAVRGAGPAFGIATRYKAKAFPVPVCFAGNLIYRFHRATAPSLIKHFRDCIKGAPRELYANVLLTAGPADKDSLVVIQMCYLGPKEEGMEYLKAISSWDGERCLLNEVNEKSFLYQQDSVAQVLRGKPGRQWFLRSSLIHSLPDEVIHKTVIQFSNTPIGCTWIFELSGGAIADFEDTCLPKEQREAIWTVAALHQWDMGIDDPRCITTAEEWMQEIIAPVSVGGPYPVFLGRHEPPSRTMACYGKNWERLAALKRKYDPDCLFRNNFWPLDKNGKPVEPLYNEPPSP